MTTNDVLLAFPTSSEKGYCLKEFMRGIQNQDYPSYDILAIDTSTRTDNYEGRLSKYGIEVIRHKWNPKEQNINSMLAEARNKIRDRVLDGGYQYCMMLDSDMLIPASTIRQLKKHDKDCVGYPYQIFGDMKTGKPCVLKSGEMKVINPEMESKIDCFNLYSWDEVYGMNSLSQVYASGLGCCLIKRRVFEKIPFRHHPSIIWGEDILFWNECDELGFEYWLDPSVRPVHLPKPWKLKSLEKPIKYKIDFTQTGQNAYNFDLGFMVLDGKIKGNEDSISITKT